VGTWAVAEKWCALHKSGELEDMDMAHSSPSGLFTIDGKGNLEWQYAAQSCEAKKLTISGDTFLINAICEYRGVENLKSEIRGTLIHGGLQLKFSNKDFPVHGNPKYVRCE
jgi:hypothetical protein